MFSLPPEEMLVLVQQEHAERRHQVAQDALADAALRKRAWSWHWPDGLVGLWSAVRPRPEVHPSDAIWPALQDYPYPHTH